MFSKFAKLMAVVLATVTLSGCMTPGGVMVPAISAAGFGRHGAVAVSTPPVFIPNAPVVATPTYGTPYYGGAGNLSPSACPSGYRMVNGAWMCMGGYATSYGSYAGYGMPTTVMTSGMPNCTRHSDGARIYARSEMECRAFASSRPGTVSMPVPAMPGTYGGPAVPFPAPIN